MRNWIARRVGLLASALGAMSGSVACGGRGPTTYESTQLCRPQATACLSDEVGQICNEDGAWATFQCHPGDRCDAGVCVGDSDATCPSGAVECLNEGVGQVCTSSGQWVPFLCDGGQTCDEGRCVDPAASCPGGTRECATDTLQRVCPQEGGDWSMVECPDGSRCVDGSCEGSCQSGATECASERIVRECRIDGSSHVEWECPPRTRCTAGACVPDAGLTCAFGEALCYDELTALKCKPDGSGYDIVNCTGGTRCDDGGCWGSVCAAGTTSCSGVQDITDLESVLTCATDGNSQELTMCRGGEECRFITEDGRYECYAPPCELGEEMCGAPGRSEEGADRLSRCEALPDGRVGWVTYLCGKPGVCMTDDYGDPRCHADCPPGLTRCAADGTAIEICGEDGTWSVSPCEVTQACLVVPTTHEVLCGDPLCALLQYDKTTYATKGLCVGEQIKRCNDDGDLGEPVHCTLGTCLPGSDGHGTCQDPTRCFQEDGWRECVTGNDAFRTCVSGIWEFTQCASGEECGDDGLGNAACGDDCSPGEVHCEGAHYRICAADGTWGRSESCPVGECNPLTGRCEIACLPDEVRCAGDVVLAADGTSLGTTGMQTCGADGAWSSMLACGTNALGQATLCRRTSHGVHLGCVACVGGAAIGGNEEGTADSRCSADGSGYQVCQDDHTWPANFASCAAAEVCAKQRDGSVSSTCFEDGCVGASSMRCVGFEFLSEPEVIQDCCAGECEAGICHHRRGDFDPTCSETVSCHTGRYDDAGYPLYEECCAGYCDDYDGCLRAKAEPCAAVTSCEVTKVGHTNVCCGSCRSDGTCNEGEAAEHAPGEYYACGSSTYLCWGVDNCSRSPSGGSGAMFANCVDKEQSEP